MKLNFTCKAIKWLQAVMIISLLTCCISNPLYAQHPGHHKGHHPPTNAEDSLRHYIDSLKHEMHDSLEVWEDSLHSIPKGYHAQRDSLHHFIDSLHHAWHDSLHVWEDSLHSLKHMHPKPPKPPMTAYDSLKHYIDSLHHEIHDSLKVWKDSLHSIPKSNKAQRDSLHHYIDSLNHAWHDSLKVWKDSLHTLKHYHPKPPPTAYDLLKQYIDSLHHVIHDSLEVWEDSLRSIPPGNHAQRDSLHHYIDSLKHAWHDSLEVWEDSLHKLPHRLADLNSTAPAATVSVYPNPASESALLHIENASGTLTFRMYDYTGRLVINRTVTNGDFRIDRAYLLAGLYIYEVDDGATVIATGRLIFE